MGGRYSGEVEPVPGCLVVSPVVVHGWIEEELRAVELIALSEGGVLDREAVVRLCRPLAVVVSLHTLHPVDESGTCSRCRRGWWLRGRECVVWPFLVSHFAGYLRSVGGPGLVVQG